MDDAWVMAFCDAPVCAYEMPLLAAMPCRARKRCTGQ